MTGTSPTPGKRGRGRPFKPGQSGNPGGRPKENAEVKALAREHTETAIQTLVHYCKQRKDAGAAVRAAQELLNRGWGKPVQPIDTTPDGELAKFFSALSDAAKR